MSPENVKRESDSLTPRHTPSLSIPTFVLPLHSACPLLSPFLSFESAFVKSELSKKQDKCLFLLLTITLKKP